MFQSFIPKNFVYALANDELLGRTSNNTIPLSIKSILTVYLTVIIVAIIVGYLIESPQSPIVRATEEIERLITKIITFLINVAPIGVFSLILANIMKLDIAQIGKNLGLLIGATFSTMFIHLFIVVPILFYTFTRINAYAYWIKCSPAWVTA